MNGALLLELAATWELQAATGGDGLNKFDAGQRVTLRACADALRMLAELPTTSPPAASASAEGGKGVDEAAKHLLPCAHCGNEYLAIRPKGHAGWKYETVYCDHCGCTVPRQSWNFRAALSTPPSADRGGDEDGEGLAAVGQALLDTLKMNADHPGLNGWSPIDCPSEVVVDLLNQLDEARAALAAKPEAQAPVATDPASVRQPMSEDEIEQVGYASIAPWINIKPGSQLHRFVRAIEAHHGITAAPNAGEKGGAA